MAHNYRNTLFAVPVGLLGCQSPSPDLWSGPIHANGALDELALTAALEEEEAAIFPLSPPPPALSSCSPQQRVFSDTASWNHLSDAFAGAQPGDTLYICPGRHLGPLVRAGGWPLSLEGMTGVPEDVVVTSRGTGAIFNTQYSAAQLSLSHLTFTTEGDDEQLITRTLGDSLVMDNCVLENIGGLNLRSPRSAHLTDVVFRNSSSYIGATGFSTSGPSQGQGPTRILIEGCHFEKLFGGGGVAVKLDTDNRHGQFALIRNTTFQDIRSVEGAALYISGENTVAKVVDSAFLGNENVGSSGAAVRVDGGWFADRMDVTLERVTIADNLAEYAPGLRVSVNGNTTTRPMLRVIDSEIFRNTAYGIGDFTAAVDISPDYFTVFDNVDLGSGAADNVPADMSWCATTAFGAATSFILDYYALPTAGIPCPP